MAPLVAGCFRSGERQLVEVRLRETGEENAVVATLVEFGSVRCLVCAEFAEHVFPALDSLYVLEGRLQFEYIDVPFPDTAYADSVTVLHRCVGRAGRSTVATHKRLMREFRQRSRSEVLSSSGGGVRSCFSVEFLRRLKEGETEAIRALGVSTTPTFLIGRQHRDGLVVGWVTIGLPRFRQMRDWIEEATLPRAVDGAARAGR